MKIVASIEWPGGDQFVTKVWGRRKDGALVFWSGPEDAFAPLLDELEDDDHCNRVGINLVDLRLDLMEHYDEFMADTDRNLLAEIDAMVETVRAAD